MNPALEAGLVVDRAHTAEEGTPKTQAVRYTLGLVNSLILANLAHRPVRTLLSILAIGVEVCMILTLVGVSYGTLDASARRARGIGADIFVRPPGSSAISLSSAPTKEALVDLIQKQPGVALAAGTMVQSLGGFNTVQGVDFAQMDKMASTWRHPGDPVKGGFHFIHGGPFAGPDDVIVDEYYAKQNKLKVGAPLKMLNHQWRVAGIYEGGKLAALLAPKDTLQRLTANEGKISAIYVKLDDASKADFEVQQLKNLLNPQDPDGTSGYQVMTVEEFTSQLNVNSLTILKVFINVVIGVASIVGFIVVFMAMYTAVLERTREIGILKAVGAGTGYILNILFRETIILAVLGTLFGILLTYGTKWIMLQAVPATLTQMTVYQWWPIAGAIAIVGALVGTVVPAYRAVKQDATEALTYE